MIVVRDDAIVDRIIKVAAVGNAVKGFKFLNKLFLNFIIIFYFKRINK